MDKIPSIDASPIFLLASERSGTNLVRHLLSNHSKISGPVAPHFLQQFVPLRRYYGDLRKPENCRVLVEDMLAVANHPYYSWKISIDFDEFYEEFRPCSMIGVCHGLYSSFVRREMKKNYICKEIKLWQFAHEIKAMFPAARFVYLIRDPRDHVSSWMRRPIRLLTPFDAAINWVHEQAAILDLIHTGGIDVFTIRYESLITDPQEIIGAILRHIGEAYEESCSSTNEQKAQEAVWNDYWKNLAKPVLCDNHGKFHDVLNAIDIEIVETLCQGYMSQYGYETITSCNWKPDKRFASKQKRYVAVSLEKAKKTSLEWRKKMESNRRLRESISGFAKERWAVNNPKMDTDNQISNLPKEKWLHRRVRLFSYALLGEGVTRSISRKVLSSLK